MTRRARAASRIRRPISFLAIVVSLGHVVLGGANAASAASLVDPYSPGVVAADLGGDLVVNSYGVEGLGVHRMTLDNGATAFAVCIQANVHHSTSAAYSVSGRTANSGALDYLTWRYLSGGSLSDSNAAGLTIATWALVGAQRNGGGDVWNGGDLSVAVLGIGPRDDIESAAIALVGEATRRRGPWNLAASPFDGTGAVTVRLSGAGGPISGEPVTFTSADGAWTEQAITNDDGLATVTPAAGTPSVRAVANGPGHAIEYAAAGVQRLAVAGPAEQLGVEIALPAAPATTTMPATTTTTMVETTTTSPPTTSPTTVPETTTTTLDVATSDVATTDVTTTTALPETTVIAATTTTVTTSSTAPARSPTPEAPETTTTATTTTTELPPTTTELPPTTSATTTPLPETFPVTGSGSRAVVRIGALFFALGGIVSYIAAGSRRRS